MSGVDPSGPSPRAESVRPVGDRSGDEAEGAFSETLRTLFDRSAQQAAGDPSGGASMFNQHGLFGAAAPIAPIDPAEPVAPADTAPILSVIPAERARLSQPEKPEEVAPAVVTSRPGVEGRPGVAAHRPVVAYHEQAHAVSTTLPAPPLERPTIRTADKPAPTARALRPAATATRRSPVDLLVQIGAGSATLAVRLDGPGPDADVLASEVTALLARHGLVLDQLKVNGRDARDGSQRRG